MEQYNRKTSKTGKHFVGFLERERPNGRIGFYPAACIKTFAVSASRSRLSYRNGPFCSVLSKSREISKTLVSYIFIRVESCTDGETSSKKGKKEGFAVAF